MIPKRIRVAFLAILLFLFLGCPSGRIRSFLDEFRPYGEGAYDIKDVRIVPGGTGFLLTCGERTVDYWMRVYSASGSEITSGLIPKGAAITVPDNRIGTTQLESFSTYEVVFTPVYGDTTAEGRPVSFKVTPGIVYLNPKAPVNGGGNSWAQATNNIQEAIYLAGSMFVAADTKQAELRIAQGIYDLTGTAELDFSVDKSLNRVNNLRLIGGYDTVTNTAAKGSYSAFEKTAGNTGFIKIETGNPSKINFENLKFSGGAAKDSGGAIYIKSMDSLSVINCIFSDNIASGGNGGAICIDKMTGILRITESIIQNNNANDFGGGIAVIDSNGTSDFTISKTDFINNAAMGLNGGGLYTRNPSVVNTESCLFKDNFAAAFGGAVYFYADTDTDEYQTRNCLYLNNESAYSGAHIGINHVSTDGKAKLTSIFSTFVTTLNQPGDIYSSTNKTDFFFYGCVFFSDYNGILVNNKFTTVYNNCLTNRDGGDSSFFYPTAGIGLTTSDASVFFANKSSPIGADGQWRTADDGLRLNSGNSINQIPQSGIYAPYLTDFTGRPRFVSYGGTQAYTEAGAYEYYPNP